MSRIAREDWLDAGLVVLRDGGHDALTIDALCRALGRTKGSFYHHFADVAALHEALLEHWETRSTEQLITQSDAVGGRSPAARRSHLHELVRTASSGVERAVQAWALRDRRAQVVRSRVDQRRVGYLAELRRAAGTPPKLAERMAQIEYAAFLGALQLFDLPSDPGWKAFAKANALLLDALTRIPHGSRGA